MDISTCSPGGESVLDGATESDSASATADGTTSTEDTSACSAEQEACSADSACSSCIEFTAVVQEACQISVLGSDTATCSEKVEVACCLVEEDVDCGSDVAVAWLGAC